MPPAAPNNAGATFTTAESQPTEVARLSTANRMLVRKLSRIVERGVRFTNEQVTRNPQLYSADRLLAFNILNTHSAEQRYVEFGMSNDWCEFTHLDYAIPTPHGRAPDFILRTIDLLISDGHHDYIDELRRQAAAHGCTLAVYYGVDSLRIAVSWRNRVYMSMPRNNIQRTIDFLARELVKEFDITMRQHEDIIRMGALNCVGQCPEPRIRHRVICFCACGDSELFVDVSADACIFAYEESEVPTGSTRIDARDFMDAHFDEILTLTNSSLPNGEIELFRRNDRYYNAWAKWTNVRS